MPRSPQLRSVGKFRPSRQEPCKRGWECAALRFGCQDPQPFTPWRHGIHSSIREPESRSFRAKRRAKAVIPREAKSKGRHSARSEAQSRNPRHHPSFRAKRKSSHSARSEAQSRNRSPSPHSPRTGIRRWHPRQGRLMTSFRTQQLTRSRKSVMGSILCHRGHRGHGEIRLMPSTSRDSLKVSSSPRFSVAFKYGVWKRL
jgi:hypothetical protein